MVTGEDHLQGTVRMNRDLKQAGRDRRAAVIFRLAAAVLASCWMLVMPAGAQNMISVAKANKVTDVKLEKSSRGIRFKKKNGKYIKGKWISFNGKIYRVKSSGYARRNGFFTYYKHKYYADKNGEVQYNKWITVKNNIYYLKKDGTMAADETITLAKSGRKYVFKKNGKLDEKNSDPLKSEQYLFVGDSRVVGMGVSVSDSNADFIGKVAEGYGYLVSTAAPRVKSILSSNPTINVIFCFGVNDLGNVDAYISYYKSFVAAYPKANIFFMAVNPVQGSSQYLSNTLIEQFNKKLKKELGKKKYIDTYTYLTETGCDYMDYAHYTVSTYQKIYSYTVDEIKKR